MKPRKSFRAVGWESLEDRQLLSTFSDHLSSLGHRITHLFVPAHKHHIKATTHHLFVAGGPVGRSFTTPGANGAVSKKGHVSIPERNIASQAPYVAASIPPASTSTQINTTPNYSNILRALTNGNSRTPSAATHSYQINTNVMTNAVRDNPGVTRIDPSALNSATASPTSTPTTTTTASAPTTAGVNGSNSGSNLPNTAAVATSPAGIAAPMAPNLNGLLNGNTPSAADLTALKTSVDTFASTYTSGANAANDAASITALKSDLATQSTTLWSESHLASKAAVASFQQSADTFAQAYTAGANAAQDSAAWKALQNSLNTFAGSLTTVSNGTGSTPSTQPAAPIFRLLPAAQPGLNNLVGALVSGPTLSPDNLNTLKSTIDTFAGAYTSGLDSTKDTAAVTALQTNLSTLLASRSQGRPFSPFVTTA